MKQKELTFEQKEVLEKLDAILKEAKSRNIGFVFDEEDGSMTAYNAENVSFTYSGGKKEEDEDELMNWDLCEIVDVHMDHFHNAFDYLYLDFNK